MHTYMHVVFNACVILVKVALCFKTGIPVDRPMAYTRSASQDFGRNSRQKDASSSQASSNFKGRVFHQTRGSPVLSRAVILADIYYVDQPFEECALIVHKFTAHGFKMRALNPRIMAPVVSKKGFQ